MPELWLRYGTTDVVLDIKSEYLLRHVKLEDKEKDSISITKELDSIHGNYDVVMLDASDTTFSIVDALRNQVSIGNIYTIKGLKYKGLKGLSLDDITNNNDKEYIFISRAMLDPIFKYSCTLTRLIRYDKGLMLKVFLEYIKRNSKDNHYTNTLNPLDYYNLNINGKSIEVAYNVDGITALKVSDIKGSYDATSSLLSKQDLEYCKACIVSPGLVYNLSDVLTTLWNVMRIVKDNGIVVLLAECIDGLGEAFEMLIDGRLDYNNPSRYLDGLECIHILKSAMNMYEVGLVTMLPESYLRRLGLLWFRRVNDALQYILKRSKQKVMVVSDACMMDITNQIKSNQIK